MSRPSNGGDARSTDLRPAYARPRFRPSGAPEGEAPSDGERLLIEADSSEVSEQQFAASLEAPSSAPRPRFVPDPAQGRKPEAQANDAPALAGARIEIEETAAETFSDLQVAVLETDAPEGNAAEECAPDFPVEMAADVSGERSAGAWDRVEDAMDDEPEWRQEVAARLHNYHSRRRKKPPRYPSLALKFDPPVYTPPPPQHAAEPARAAYQPGGRSEAATAAAADPEEITIEAVEQTREVPFDATNIIEFPRPLVPPPPRPDELAEPILDLPRILDAPEAVSKQVPLGGITLEPEQPAVASELELPLRVAPLGRRVIAATLDGGLVGVATLMFAVIVDKIATLLPSIHVLLGLGVALPAILWAIFQYTFLVYTGSTPGMRLTGLRLSDFDGSAPGRGTRRWRALAMALSAVSMGLGFLWCLLDEDTLCWHDRITRTYLDAGRVADHGAQQGPVFPERVFAGLRRAEAFLKRRAEETSDEAGPLQH